MDCVLDRDGERPAARPAIGHVRARFFSVVAPRACGGEEQMKNFFATGLVTLVMLVGGLAPAAGEGFLRVTSEPAGVAISVEGELLGKTPLLAAHAPGEFPLRAELEGHLVREETITIAENEITRLHLEMETPRAARRPGRRAERAHGQLVVTSDRADTVVFLDGRRVDASVPLAVRDVRPGERSLILVSGDRAAYFQVVVVSGQTVEIDHSFDGDRVYQGTVAGETLTGEAPTVAPAAVTPEMAAPPAAEAPVRLPLLQLAIEKAAAPEGERAPLSTLWQEANVVEMVVRYRPSADESWQVRQLASTAREGISLELPSADYQFELVSTHYREQRGIASLLMRSTREKVREYRDAFTRRLDPDTVYRLVVEVGEANELSHRFEETPRPPADD